MVVGSIVDEVPTIAPFGKKPKRRKKSDLCTAVLVVGSIFFGVPTIAPSILGWREPNG